MSENNGKEKQPFWHPWGIWGYLWRTLLFLGGLVALSFLFAALLNKDEDPNRRGRGPTPPADSVARGVRPPGWDTITRPADPYRNLPDSIRNGTPVRDWIDSIQGVPELPRPDDNRIPPIDSSRIVPNPIDSICQIIGDQLIVFFNSKDLRADMASFAQQFKRLYPGNAYQVLYYNPLAGTMLLGVPESELITIMNRLPEQITGIDFRVTVNSILQQTYTPTDPDFNETDYDAYFKLIQAYDAWDVTQGSSEVRVAIIDSYFDLTHPEIGERYVDPINIPQKTRNVLPPNQSPQSDYDLQTYCHGTHVAGIAIGGQDNGHGCSGIAPKCSWIPVSIGDGMTSFDLIEAILYSVYHGADVINISIGRAFDPVSMSLPLRDQVRYAKEVDKQGEDLWRYVYKVANDHNCVICTAAGNDDILLGMDPMNRSEQIIKVEAVDSHGIKADFSNFGIVPEARLNYSTLAAPGINLWSSTPESYILYWAVLSLFGWEGDFSEDSFQTMSGTSMASPVVAGAVALLKSKNKNLTTDQVIKILTMTAKQTDTVNHIGPTLQIRDALDATGGELANFDDLMSDHNLLIGKWRSTHVLQLMNEDNGEQLDEVWCYFIFNSATEGMVEFHTINSRKVYTAPLTVVWNPNSITIYQQGNAIASDGDDIIKDDYVCKPNSNRLLEATAKRGSTNRYKFMLEKVN